MTTLWLRRLGLIVGVFALAGCSTVGGAFSAINPFDGDGEADEAPEPEEPDDGRIAVLSFDQRLEEDASLADVPVFVPPPYVNVDWTQPGGFATNAMQHTDATGPLERIWRRKIGQGTSNSGAVVARPIVAGGRVFAMDARGDVVAVDAGDGDVLWRREFEPQYRKDRALRGGGLAFSEGRLFVATGHRYITALDAETGDELWRAEAAAPIHGAPTVAADRVFVITQDNDLLALTASTGQTLWNYPSLQESARILSAPSPAVLSEVVVAPFASGELAALRVENGLRLWSDTLTRAVGVNSLSEINDIAGAPVLLDDGVYAISHSGVLAGLDIVTGERLWVQPAGGVHAPWVAGENLFVVTSDAQIIAVDRRNGRIRWLTELPAFKNEKKRKGRIAWAGPIMAGDRLVLTSSEGDLFFVSPRDGGILERRELKEPVFVAPVIAQETVYVLTDEASLIALR
ncbi:MAG: PQQ-binding-like beta-propeller repeat protein [Maricaulaceae bacterium]